MYSRSIFILLFVIGTSFSAAAQETKDSLQYGITDKEIDEVSYFNVVFRNDAGIDSIKWPLWTLGWTYTVQFYDIDGLINSQDISDIKVVCHTYKLFPEEPGKYVLPNAIVWHQGEGKEVILADTLTVRKKTDSVSSYDIGSFFKNEPKTTIDFEIECPPNQTCTKAFFVDTLFDQGDTLTLIIAANKYAKFQIPIIKDFRYITHSTTTNTSITDGTTKRKSYIAVKYELERNLKKIKTPTFKARIGARTQYIKKLKIKKPKPKG
ncbi:MAG: hypothetical protein JXQ87_15010 [Bacteroidia bacterium]